MELFKLNKSKNYEDFSFYNFNRPVNNSNVQKLMNSIGQYNLISPIVVSEDGKIIDGQNRFVALKNLKLPIHYVIRKTDKNILNYIIDAQFKKTWSYMDYINCYSELGYDVYTEIKNIHKQTEKKLNTSFNVGKILCIYTDYNGAKFRAGTAVLYKDFGDKLLSLLHNIVSIYNHDFTYYGSMNIKALRVILKRNKIFDSNHFLKQIQTNKLHVFSNSKDQINEIISIYNKNTFKKNKIV